MGVAVVLPKVGLTMEEGTIDEWLVEPGAVVTVGQPLLRMATDKVDVEVEAEAPGIVQPVAAVGQTLRPGDVIAWLLAEGEEVPDASASPDGVAPQVISTARESRPESMHEVGRVDAGRLRVSPNARRRARELGVDLASVTGTGPGGRIISEDVDDAVAAKPSAGPEVSAAAVSPGRVASPLVRRLARDLGVDLQGVRGSGPGGTVTRGDLAQARLATRPASGVHAGTASVTPLTGMRGAIARNMVASLGEMAQLTLGHDADVTALIGFRAAMKEQLDATDRVPTITDFVARAVVLALGEHPGLNAAVRDDGIHELDRVNLGVAVAVPRGLVVPIVRDASDLSLDELGREISRLAESARNGQLMPDDFAGGTFAITSLGTYGVDFFTPVINPGNVGILGVGRVRDGVRWEGDTPRRTDVITLSLTFDHRAVDGAPAAEFLRSVCAWLARPLALFVS